jgi:Gas vesicle protein
MPDTMNRMSPAALSSGSSHTASLVDILDRVLDKGLVVAGDIKISLAEVELLTIRIRLLICSIDKAEQIGMDWWKYDRNLSPGRSTALREDEALKKQIRMLERRVAALTKERRAGRGRRATLA